MTDLVDTTEMYLRTIVDLEEEGIPPFRARISERLNHSGPTVSQTVARMERDGLLVVEADRQLVPDKAWSQKSNRGDEKASISGAFARRCHWPGVVTRA